MEHVIDLIKRRRSIRIFREIALERAEVELLLEAGCYAPSGHNRQSWLFTAVVDPNILKRINALIRDGFRRLQLEEVDPVELYDAKRKVESQGESYCFYYHAPCLVITSNDRENHNGRADCACALENMFLTAYDRGLGACWVNQLHWLDRDLELRRYLETLGIPNTHTICGSGVFGHPTGSIPKAAPRKESTWRIIG